MQIKTNTINVGGSIYMRIPPTMCQHLGITSVKNTPVILQDEEGKRGKYMSAWKQEGKE